MAQQVTHPATDFYFVVILFLLSYVMSSAPRYVRDIRQDQERGIGVPAQTVESLKKIISAYTFKPYSNAWKLLRDRPDDRLAEK